ncbi:MAG: tRNA epoxyqueuosine(34) reductase QueG [Elusimicrobia bacterium]|nr:tRNA epoxyqueuosine(34) reductase QueG [Elusimicrobiota bacterium]
MAQAFTPRQLTDLLRAEARELGADHVGFASAVLPSPSLPGGPQAYEAWVQAGHHATMEYMARDSSTRRDITHWFPAAKSVVLLAFSYAGAPQKADAPHGAAKIARYALSEDYHDALRGKLRSLQERLREAAPEVLGRIFVDTSPVLERLYARTAGIGWVGKNTMLLSRRLGSFFLLCGMALDHELVYDEPTTDHCGSCTRCLTACPTEAFPKPRTLDASRCIAYLTIEHRGSIPQPLRPGVGDWIFGCDICQEVCPWNRFTEPGRVFPAILPRHVAPEDAAETSPEEFRSRFGNTPVERARWRGWVRNALLVMGNSGDPRYVPVLERFIEHSDPVIAEQAAWSLRQVRQASGVL